MHILHGCLRIHWTDPHILAVTAAGHGAATESTMGTEVCLTAPESISASRELPLNPMSLRGKVWFASEVSVLPKLIPCLIQILFSGFFDVHAYVKKLPLKFTSKNFTSKTCINLRQKTFNFYVKKLVKIPLRQKAAVYTSKQYFTRIKRSNLRIKVIIT